MILKSWKESIYEADKYPLLLTSLVGGWTNPFEKYESKWESSPKFGVKIKNVWNHHPVHLHCFTKKSIDLNASKSPGPTGLNAPKNPTYQVLQRLVYLSNDWFK